MKKLIHFGLLSLSFLLSGTAFGQSGQWVQTTPLGCKAFTWREGSVEIEWGGECKDGLASGLGPMKLYVDKKLAYVASFNFFEGKVNGQGTQTFANGEKYVGEFKDGKSNGQGTQTFANGEKYAGEFKDGKSHGQGTKTFANGDKYVGEFKDGTLSGQATYVWANGDKHVGEFENNKRNGQGAFTAVDGYKYVGEFKDDKRNGQGVQTFANGEKYVGKFKDDKPNGSGVNTLASGERLTGTWIDGKYVSSTDVQQTDLLCIGQSEHKLRPDWTIYTDIEEYISFNEQTSQTSGIQNLFNSCLRSNREKQVTCEINEKQITCELKFSGGSGSLNLSRNTGKLKITQSEDGTRTTCELYCDNKLQKKF